MYIVRYIGALIYDAFILVSLFFVFTALCLLFRQGLAIASHSLWYQLSLISIIYSYYAVSYKAEGQTIGMRAWHIKVQSETNHLSQKQILGRIMLTLPAIAVGILRFKNPLGLLKCWTKSYIVLIK